MLTFCIGNEHGNSWRIAIIGIGVANSIAIILIIILLIVRSRCPTLFAGSKFWTNDHFTESNDSDNIDVRIYIKILFMILYGNK